MRYILGAKNMTLKEILTQAANLAGQPPPRVQLPHNLVLPIAYVAEAWARFTNGSEPLVTVDGVRLAKKQMFFSYERAKRELGFNPRPVEEGFRDAVDWFRQNGYLQ
jgi:dihydroflavonol-4-reductase